MAEKDYAPLSSACVRALHDKLYDKRKAAALEIEKMVKDFHASNNVIQIKKLLKVLGQDFANSQNAHARKGGLIGLAAIAIALGPESSQYIPELLNPILACFSDNDSRVRYYACEALYNVVKMARGAVLPNFPQLFTALSTLADDPDQNVKAASELLDRILKDIVTESHTFELPELVPLLRERIYTRKNFSRQFIISWVSVLHNVPSLDLTLYLPELLDGLFRILDDSAFEIHNACKAVLDQFICSIKKDPSRVDFAGMVSILISHAQAQHSSLQLTAITWILEFVQLSGRTMLPFAAGILAAILPCLSYDAESKSNDNRGNTRETAKAVSFSLLSLVSKEAGSEVINEDQIPVQLDTEGVLEVLVRCLGTGSATPTKAAALTWMHHLQRKMPNQVSEKLQQSSPALVNALSDPSDDVVRKALAVLASLSSPTCPGGADFFTSFLRALLKLVHTERHLLDDRGPFILRQLCVLLNAEGIFRTLSQILLEESDLQFARSMVDCLHGILLTSGELAHLRKALQQLASPESAALFVCLYETWSHNPVATVSLCLLSQCYQHTSVLIRSFGDMDVTVEFLTEVDKLVQLIESPIFTYLRLQLLDGSRNQPLLQSLYGLLMLLPQTDAFHILHRRLACVPATQDAKQSPWKEERPDVVKIDFDRLMTHFKSVQDRHHQEREKIRTNSLLSRGISLDIEQ